MDLKRRCSSDVTPPDELAFLSLLDGTAPPVDKRMHQGEVELKVTGTKKWRPAKMILTNEHLIMCTTAATAGMPSHSPSHGEGDVELVDDAILLSQVWYCKAAADRKRRRFAMAAERFTNALGWVTHEHSTGWEDLFLLKTTAAGVHRGSKFVFRCSRKKDSQQWSFAIRQQLNENALSLSKMQQFQRLREILRLTVDYGPFQILVALLVFLNFLVSVFDTEYHPPRDSYTGQLLADFEIVFTCS
jgi:hypothetical protein